MLANLNAEIARNGYSKKDIAIMLNLSYKAFLNKISEKTSFTLHEIRLIMSLFPNFEFNYLFATREVRDE